MQNRWIPGLLHRASPPPPPGRISLRLRTPGFENPGLISTPPPGGAGDSVMRARLLRARLLREFCGQDVANQRGVRFALG